MNQDDAEATFRWRRSERAAMLGGAPPSLEAQRQWISSRPKDELNFIIELKSGKAVGTISLIEMNQHHSRAQTARFLIGEPHFVAGLPVAVESMSLLYRLAFEEMALNRLWGFIAKSNTRMIKWQKFLGMEIEGTWRGHLKQESGFEDAVLLGLSRSRYEEISIPRMNQLIKMGK